MTAKHALRSHRLNGQPDIPMIAGLIADDARAAMLLALYEESAALSMSALASAARIGLPAASAHLARLVGGGLLTCEPQGRTRLYRLAGPHVAEILESLALIAPLRPTRTLDESTRLAALRVARTCFDHLAGRLGATLFDVLVQSSALIAPVVPGSLGAAQAEGVPNGAAHGQVRVLAAADAHGAVPGAAVRKVRRVRSGLGRVALGPRAAEVFGRLGIELDETPDVKACLDWTESRPHLSGGVGAAVCTRFLEAGWVLHRPNTRALRISDAGRAALHDVLGLQLD